MKTGVESSKFRGCSRFSQNGNLKYLDGYCLVYLSYRIKTNGYVLDNNWNQEKALGRLYDEK